jgi:hypothetical protein
MTISKLCSENKNRKRSFKPSTRVQQGRRHRYSRVMNRSEFGNFGDEGWLCTFSILCQQQQHVEFARSTRSCEAPVRAGGTVQVTLAGPLPSAKFGMTPCRACSLRLSASVGPPAVPSLVNIGLKPSEKKIIFFVYVTGTVITMMAF